MQYNKFRVMQRTLKILEKSIQCKFLKRTVWTTDTLYMTRASKILVHY